MHTAAARSRVLCAPVEPDLQSALFASWTKPALESPPRILLVPHRALGRFLIEAHVRRTGFAAGLRAVTLAELALDLTADSRSAEGRRLAGADAQAWLLRELQRRHARPPTCFDAALEVRGFRAVLHGVFESLAHAGLAGRRDIERVLAAHGFDLPLRLRHVLELALAFRASFEATHDDIPAVLARAGEIAPGRFRAALGARHLDLYGFVHLTALERRVVEACWRDPDLEIALYVPSHDSEPALVAWARACGARPDDSPRLPSAAPAVRFVAAPSEEAEADEVARAVLRAAESGMAFDSMAVVARTSQPLALVRSALGRARVPCRIVPGPPLRSTRTGRAILAFLDAVEGELRPDPVLGLLAIAPLRADAWADVPADAIPSAWERAAREACVARGASDWIAKLERHATDLEAQCARLEAESEPAERARHGARAARELARLTAALEAEREGFPARARWSDFVQRARDWMDRALLPGAEHDAVSGALARLGLLDGLGRGLPTRGDFREAVRGALADAVLAETGHSGVWLATARVLAGASFDLVCMVGLREGEWPLAVHDDPVLPDRMREALGERLGDRDLVPPRAEARARDVESFATWCRAARRRLVLSWARLDPVTGANCLPSVLVLEAASRLAGHPLDYETLLAWEGVERVPLRRAGVQADTPALDVAELDLWIASDLAPVAARRYVAGLGTCAARGLALDRLRQDTPRFTSVDGWLGGAARDALRDRAARSLSVTQVVTYTTCPFRYFLRYLLRLEPLDRDDPHELTELEAGRLVHRILERFHRELALEGRVVADLDDATLAARLSLALDAVCGELEARGRTGARLLWDVRKQRLRDDLGRALRSERARAGRWRPQAFELRFGRQEKLAPVLGLARGAVALHGVIDRVDVDATTGGSCVVDYKTGRPLEPRSGAPQAVQLVVYLHVITGGDASRLAGSEGRFVHVTRRGGFAVQRLPGAALLPRRDDLATLVGGVVDGIAAGAFFPVPGPAAQNCAACDYRGTCDARIEALAERKVTSGQTAGFATRPEFASLLESDAPPGGDGEPGEDG